MDKAPTLWTTKQDRAKRIDRIRGRKNEVEVIEDKTRSRIIEIATKNNGEMDASSFQSVRDNIQQDR